MILLRIEFIMYVMSCDLDGIVGKPSNKKDIEKFINSLVDEHNKYRYLHDADLLIFDKV